MNTWSLRTIAECASSEPYATQIGPFGEKIRAGNYTTTGAPVLRGTKVNPDGRFYDDDFVFIDSDLADAEFGKFVCEADDVILCHKGTLGKIGIIPKESRFKRYIMGNSMMKVRCDRSKLEPLYLYYWLCSRDGQHYLVSRVSQVGVPQIQRPLTTLRAAQLPVPPLSEQKVIAAVLGALDDKIELNRRTNTTLEASARALFKSWFVDFEPVRANLDGRQLDAATAALFSSEFEDSELGPIPKGWRVGKVSDAFDVTMGQSPPGETYNHRGEGLAFYQGRADFGFRFPTRRVFCSAPTRLGKTGDTLVSVRAPVGDINMADEPCCIGRGVAAVRHKSGASSFTYYSMKHFEPDFARFEAEGTVFGSINKQNFAELPLTLPPNDVVAAYERLASPFDEEIAVLEHQSRALAATRDALLPKLLSGELRASSH
jgi:type I restriction enzyme S subunit